MTNGLRRNSRAAASSSLRAAACVMYVANTSFERVRANLPSAKWALGWKILTRTPGNKTAAASSSSFSTRGKAEEKRGRVPIAGLLMPH